jgi:hypothetical protein
MQLLLEQLPRKHRHISRQLLALAVAAVGVLCAVPGLKAVVAWLPAGTLPP